MTRRTRPRSPALADVPAIPRGYAFDWQVDSPILPSASVPFTSPRPRGIIRCERCPHPIVEPSPFDGEEAYLCAACLREHVDEQETEHEARLDEELNKLRDDYEKKLSAAEEELDKLRDELAKPREDRLDALQEALWALVERWRATPWAAQLEQEQNPTTAPGCAKELEAILQEKA